MAIFGKADADLPLVTQLMQANVNDGAELLRFWRRCVALANYAGRADQPPTVEGEINQAADGLVEHETGEGFVPVAPSLLVWQIESDHELTDCAFDDEVFALQAQFNDCETAAEYLSAYFRRACTWGQTLVSTLHETQTVDMRVLGLLRKTFPTDNLLQPKPFVIYEEAPPEREQYPDFIALSRLQLTTDAGMIVPSYFVAAQIEEALKMLWNKKARLLVCEECRNIYLSSNKLQTYCSTRCSARVRVRRQRAKENNSAK